MTEVICVTCGTEIIINRFHNRRRQYCSSRCRHMARKAKLSSKQPVVFTE